MFSLLTFSGFTSSVYLQHTQQQDVGAFPNVVFGFFPPGLLQWDLRLGSLPAGGRNDRQNVLLLWGVEYVRGPSCGGWYIVSVSAVKRLKEQGGKISVYQILWWHWKFLSLYLFFCFVLSILPKLNDYWNCLWNCLKLLVNCLACLWECHSTLQIRLRVPLCWSGSLLLWPWKHYCPVEWQRPSPSSRHSR